jgi:hypothetical protein
MHQSPLQLEMGKARVALGDPDTSAFVLLTIAMWAFGDEVLGDPETGVEAMDPSELWAGLNEVFGTWVTEEGENKLNALMLAMQGDLFYRDIEVFLSVAQAMFDGDLGDMITSQFEDAAEGITSVEIMWAVLEVELARQDEDGPPTFSDGIIDLINRVMRIEQEDHEEDVSVVRNEYYKMLDHLREIGVPVAAIRMLDEEYAETMEIFDTPGEISAVVGS